MTAAALEAKRILVGEDDLALSTLFQLVLSGEGFAVEACVDGVTSLARVAQLHPSILILDSDLPPSGGFDIIRQVRKQGNLVPVVLVSSKADEQVRKACLEWNQVEYIAKPFSPQELLLAIARVGHF